MTKWIVALVVVIILVVLGFMFRASITGLFSSSPNVEDQTPTDPLAGWGTFASTTMGVSVRYAPGYTANGSFANTSVNPKKPILGVSFTVPASMATGTNLGSDTYISVEQLPRANNCTGDIFLADNVAAHDLADGGLVYSFATSSGAGAGNRYEESVYALKDSKPCTAVRYYVHYSVLENYPEGTVRAFDWAALKAQFDQARRTLQVTPAPATVTP